MAADATVTSPAPLVSILIPTYNRPELLPLAVKSALEQSYADSEILIQDNASDYDVGPIVAAFNDPRISVARNESTLPMALNWQALALRARGKYVAFLNDDDIWEKDYLATLVAVLERKPDLVLAFCDHFITDAEGSIDPERTAANSRRWMRSRLAEGEHRPFGQIALVYRSIWTASATVFRRDAVDWAAIPEEAGVVVDLYLAYLAARGGGGAWYCHQRLVRYRVHGRSTTASVSAVEPRLRCARDSMFSWQAFAADPALRSSAPYFRVKLLHNRFRYALCRWRQGMRDPGVFAILRLLSPALFAWQLRYMVQLRRIRI